MPNNSLRPSLQAPLSPQSKSWLTSSLAVSIHMERANEDNDAGGEETAFEREILGGRKGSLVADVANTVSIATRAMETVIDASGYFYPMVCCWDPLADPFVPWLFRLWLLLLVVGRAVVRCLL